MISNLHEWLHLLLRMVHVLAGIAWIGNSFFFMWMDSHLEEGDGKDVAGSLWMVHSGGFYQVEKRKIGPGRMPKVLHWFRWEAGTTWISGVLLLGVVYYLGGGAYLVDPSVSSISAGAATALGIGLLIAAWFLYDTLWRSPLARHQRICGAVSFLAVAAVAYGLTRVLSGRAAFIHVGAMLGTLMAGNVWIRILPAQRQMIGATERGEQPDFSLGAHAKRRSIHNNYMTVPLIFIMLSNHFPSMFGHGLNWLVLALLMLAGAGARHVINVRHRASPCVVWGAVSGVAALLAALFLLTLPSREPLPATATAGARVPFTQARAVISQRCVSCHSAAPSDRTFGGIAPAGVTLDTPEKIRAMATRIRFRAVDSKTMPFANKTGMTEEERQLLGRWVDQGAVID